jgi:hypothetical protein
MAAEAAAAATAAAGSNILGNVISGLFQNRNVDKTNAANMQLAELANQHNIENWNMMNAYNTPAAQMQRLKDAGLNPFSAAASVTGGNAAAMAAYQAPKVDYNSRQSVAAATFAGLSQAIAQYQDIRHRQLENRNEETKAEILQEDLETKTMKNEKEGFWRQYYQNMASSGYQSMLDKENLGGVRAMEAKKMYDLNWTQGYAKRQLDAKLRAASDLHESVKAREDFLKDMREFEKSQAQYEQDHQDTTFWVNTGSKILNSIFSIWNPFKKAPVYNNNTYTRP